MRCRESAGNSLRRHFPWCIPGERRAGQRWACPTAGRALLEQDAAKPLEDQGHQSMFYLYRGLQRGSGYSPVGHCKKFSPPCAHSSLIKGTDLSLPRLSWYMHGIRCTEEGGDGMTQRSKATSADVFETSFTSGV